MKRIGEFGEGTISSLPTGTGRGSDRFSLKRVLIGVTIGATAGLFISLAVGALTTDLFSNVPASQIVPMIKVTILNTATGSAVGGLMAHYRCYRH